MVNNDINYIRKELDELQLRMANLTVTTEYALSNSDATAPTTGWSTTRPSPTDQQKFVWARNIMNFGYGDIITEPYVISEEQIVSIDVEYIAHSDAYQPPSQQSEYWQTTAPSIQAGQYIWTRTKITKTTGVTYTSPVRITGLQGTAGSNGINGKAGKDGKGLEFIFKRSATPIDWSTITPQSNDPYRNPANIPTNWTGNDGNTAKEFQDDDFYLSSKGWTDDQEEVTESYPYQYVSTRTKTVASGQTDASWNAFTQPKLWSTYGEKPYCHVRYADINPPTQWSQTYPTPQTISNGETNYHKYEGYLWNDEETLSVANQNPALFTWRIFRPTIGIAGEEGSFLHIAYADDEAGTGFDLERVDGDYMGTCVTWEAEDPNDADLYNWVRIRGNDGIGNEFVYYTTSNASFTGTPSNIQNSPNHDRWCERPYGVSEDYPYCYISVREYDNTRQSWGNWTQAVLWARYGIGEQGVQGERGEDGIGLEMIFARNNSTSTPPTFNGSKPNHTYEGTADFTGTVSRTINGQSVAFHYYDDDYVPNGWSDNQQGVDENHTVEWVAKRLKTVPSGEKEAEWGDFNTPTVWATYSKDGVSVQSIEEQYGTSNSSATEPSTWTGTAPTTFAKGVWYWTRSKITYSDSSQSTPHIDYVGTRIINMVDSDTEHYIFFRTTTKVAPTTPTSSTTIIANINNGGNATTGNEWYEDVIAPTPQLPYLWCSKQEYNGITKSWGTYCTPYLVDTYVYYGSNGEEGDIGIHGIDGYVLNGDDIDDKTTDVTSKAMNDSVPSNFVSKEFNHHEYTVGNNTTYLNRQGSIVLLNLRGSFTIPTVTNNDGEYVPILTLESWAIPIATTYFGDVVNTNRYRVRNDNGTSKLEMFAIPTQSGDSTYLAGSTMYFSDDTLRPSAQLTNLTAHNIGQGEPVSVQLVDDEQNPLKGEKIYFKINDVIYQRETNAVGVASVNMNIFTSQRNGFQVIAWYDGHNYENGEIQGLSEYKECEVLFNVFVKQAVVKFITWGIDDRKGYYAEIKTNTGIPLRYHDAELSIGGSDPWVTQTDGEGRVYYDLMGYEDDVEIIVTIPTSSRVLNTISEKHIEVRSNRQVFTKRYYPVAIESNESFVNQSPTALTSIGDMNYVQSIVTPSNSELSELVLDYDLDLPLSATVQSVNVTVRFTGLEGDKQLERPSWKAPRVRLFQGNNFTYLNGRPSTIQCDHKNCGTWKTVTYTSNLADTDISPVNSTEMWKNIKLGLDDLINYGGGDGHTDSGRFAVDYVEMNIQYVVDNEVSLIPTVIPSIALYTEDMVVYEKNINNRFVARLFKNNEPLANATVIIRLDGHDYTRETDANGEASVGTGGFAYGNYSVITSYTENDTTITQSNVLTIKPRIVIKGLSKYFHCNEQYEVQLYNVDGTVAPNETVTFNIRGVEYTRVSNEKGIVTININLQAGTYSITTIWEGIRRGEEIEVLPLITANDLYMDYADGSKFVANVVDCQGNPLEGATVTFNINGVLYQKTTDTGGNARLTIHLQAGRYIITSTYNGESIANLVVVGSNISSHTKTVHISATNGVPRYQDQYGTQWTSATPECTFTRNDGALMVTEVLTPNSTADTLTMAFEPNLPNNAVIKSITATVRYGGRIGTTGIVHHEEEGEDPWDEEVIDGGTYLHNQGKLTLFRMDGIQIGLSQNLPYIDIGYEQSVNEYWYENSYTFNINQSYSTGLWNRPTLALEGITNVGDRTGRFGIDYISIAIYYES